MISIEFALLIVILILIIILIGQKYLAKAIKHKLVEHKLAINRLLNLLGKTYSILQKARRFSLFYVFKNNFYWLYLFIAIGIIIIKILLHFDIYSSNSLPTWIHNSVDFLIISSAWEIICIVTKLLDRKISRK